MGPLEFALLVSVTLLLNLVAVVILRAVRARRLPPPSRAAPAEGKAPAPGVPMLWVTIPEQAERLAELEAAYSHGETLRWVDAAGQPLFNLLEVWDFRAPSPGGAFSPAMTARESG